MLVARMVHDQIHDQLHPALVQPVQHGPEGLHAAVFRRDVHVVGDIVPAVRTGRGIQRREPHAVNAQLLQIVQLLQYAPQIADPVAVAVAEAPRPDLIKTLSLNHLVCSIVHFSPSIIGFHNNNIIVTYHPDFASWKPEQILPGPFVQN